MAIEDIVVEKLKFPETIRVRPGMYIGSTQEPRVIIRELVDNAVDELINAHANNVIVQINADHSVIVDDGRGLPVYSDIDYTDKTITHAIFTEHHTGSKFKSLEEGHTLGMNGIGSKATNALSTRFIALINISAKDLSNSLSWIIEKSNRLSHPVYIIAFERGVLSLEDVIEDSEIDKFCTLDVQKFLTKQWSTCVVAFPDPEIFNTIKFTYDITSLEIARMFVTEDQRIYLNGTEVPKFSLNRIFDKDHFISDKIFDLSYNGIDTKWHLKFAFSSGDFSFSCKGSVNTLITNEGYHIRLSLKHLGTVLAEVYPSLSVADIKYGIRLFTLVFCNDPQFNGQNKEKLDWIKNINEGEVFKSCRESFTKLIKDNKKFFDALRDKIVDYKREVGKLALKDYVNSVVKKGDDLKRNRGLGSDVYDCSTTDRSKAELFVVEGKSAGSNLLQCRDPKTIAVQPLRGKPLNSAKVGDLKTVLDNKEMLSLINVIGAGVHPFADVSKARYGKIVMMADADPDGKAINALLLGTIAAFIPELISAEMVYTSEVPLYKQAGKYIFDEALLDRSKPFTRFKGLGEMNSDELFYCAVDHKTRRLTLITDSDISKAVHLIKSSSAKKQLMVDSGILKA